MVQRVKSSTNYLALKSIIRFQEFIVLFLLLFIDMSGNYLTLVNINNDVIDELGKIQKTLIVTRVLQNSCYTFKNKYIPANVSFTSKI